LETGSPKDGTGDEFKDHRPVMLVLPNISGECISLL
jgi:hypothetical protein